MSDHVDRRKNPPPVFSSLEEYEEFFRRVSRQGAEDAIREIGLDDEDVRDSLKDLVAITPTLKSMAEGWKAMGWLKRALLWVAGLAGAVAAIWYSIKGPPHP